MYVYVGQISVYVRAASIIINEETDQEMSARRYSSRAKTNNVQNSYMAEVVALTSLWVIF